MGLKPFPKGVSGNPSGRPKLAAEFRDDCRAILPKALERWKEEIKSKGPDWLRASELVAAYAVGKPTQRVEVDDISAMTDEQLEARYRALIAEGAPAGSTH